MGIPGKSIYDRMITAGPVLKALAPRLDAIITLINEMRALTVSGQNPHKVNDTADAVTTANAADSLDQVIDLAQPLIDNYETHIGSTTYHLGADSTNVITELGVAKEVYTLLNEMKVDYEANRINVTTHHGGSGDTTNTITADNATTKATAFALANDLRAALIAHMALTAGSVHGAADAVNGVALVAIAALTAASTWTQIAALTDAIRVAYEAHRVYTTGTTHAGADSTNTVTATAVGTITTAVYAGLNELKTDFNAHCAEFGTYHAVKDATIVVAAAAATTLATAITLVNAQKAALNDHLTRADTAAAIPALSLED